MSIINLITSRGYLPTCRIMQLMLWMDATVSNPSKGAMRRDFFVDVGANIGSCKMIDFHFNEVDVSITSASLHKSVGTVHMAALGFPVISVEPVPEHISTIR